MDLNAEVCWLYAFAVALPPVSATALGNALGGGGAGLCGTPFVTSSPRLTWCLRGELPDSNDYRSFSAIFNECSFEMNRPYTLKISVASRCACHSATTRGSTPLSRQWTMNVRRNARGL